MLSSIGLSDSDMAIASICEKPLTLFELNAIFIALTLNEVSFGKLTFHVSHLRCKPQINLLA